MVKTKIGPNEITGMNTYYIVSLGSKTYSDEGKVWIVSIITSKNGLFMRDGMAIKDNYYGYKNKKDAEKLYKEVIQHIKSSGEISIYNIRGPTEVKK